MADHGCLMTDPMMRAVLSNDKDVTRRIGKTWARAKVGDRLWFREAFCAHYGDNYLFPPHGHAYRADWSRSVEDVVPRPKWTPSILMPRSVCRATGIITDIRQVPLQDIDEADALREGMGTLTWADVVALASAARLKRTLTELTMVLGGLPALDIHRTARDQGEWFGCLSMRDRFQLGFALIHSHEIWQMNPLVWRVEWRRE